MTSDCAHDTVIAFDYPSSAQARRVQRALEPEVGDIDGDRSSVSLQREGSVFEVRVEASDVVALRASLNTWLSLVGVAEAAGDLR